MPDFITTETLQLGAICIGLILSPKILKAIF